jgi:hypothetical protein
MRDAAILQQPNNRRHPQREARGVKANFGNLMRLMDEIFRKPRTYIH